LFIKKASLRDIIDLWENGNGALAKAFTAEEVKHLIRSLFQNTSRRSAALAKIK
jgi:centromere/kinetochore protein zw10, putative